MSNTPRPLPKNPMQFEAWKLVLRKDCEAQGKLFAFDSLGDYALKLLWEEGLDPSVDGIVGSKQNGRVD